ncbi:MAG: hypothetical protein JXR49_09305 [Acidobacteria bacterium]|nr:hypothetical protein [Acidobacteriota bacterium]
MRYYPGLLYLMLLPLLAAGELPEEDPPLEKSAYFAYVDREFIFTVEVVKPGIPLLNFVSMVDREEILRAKDIRLALGNRQVVVETFNIETALKQPPLIVTTLRMHPRSSFGFRLEGNFGKAKELYGAEIKLDEERFKLEPLSKFNFETLVLKVNRLNLGSPDFSDDFRVLKLDFLGNRSSRRR